MGNLLSSISWKNVLYVVVLAVAVYGIYYAYKHYGKKALEDRAEHVQKVRAAEATDQLKVEHMTQVREENQEKIRNNDAEKIYNTSLYPFFDIKIGNEDAGRVHFELFDEIVPRTCMNFRTLCMKSVSGKGDADYKGVPFHRIIKNFMIQCGDTTNGDGTGGMSIYGRNFEDENFELTHNQEGLLSMANAGPNTNGSQFFITTKAPLKHLDGKHVVFGMVTKGYEIIKRIEKLQTNGDDSPTIPVYVSNCGLEELE
jgi:cyclophilin family peptidyl-prolyl cis-trans isomerase